MNKIIRVLAVIFILNSIIFVMNSNGQWIQQPPMNLSLKFNCVRFLNWQIGFLGGGGGQILKTVNYGTNWTSQSTYTDLDVGNLLFFDFNTGFAMCGSNLSDSSKILRTTNGGFVWDIKYTGHHIVFTKGIHFINSNTGYVSGMSDNDSAIVKTTDGGWTWQKTKTNTVKGIEKFSFVDVNTGFASGYGTDSKACVLKTTDGGVSWTKVFVHPAALKFASLYFINSNTGWVVGSSASDNSLIQKTTNGGINWVDQLNQHPANQKLNDIQMLNENTGWIVGDASQIVKTTNGGLNWRAQTNPAGTFSAIEFRGADTGYVAGSVGYDGLLLKTHNGGGSVSVQNISSEIPASYSLGQNYPNPFNPITNVKFSIINSEQLKLIVFDIMGREVQTLVNERLQPGTYEVTFDGSRINSGVYFYQMVSGNYKETKRLLLLK
ncbi:MAG: YCF48-related protein [Ignavibacteria bacterium]